MELVEIVRVALIELVRELDAAGIEQAVVLSVGYSFADERKALPDPDRLTREQNDWTSTAWAITIWRAMYRPRPIPAREVVAQAGLQRIPQ